MAGSLLLAQSRDGAAYFRLSGELSGIGFAKSLANVLNLLLMNVNIGFERMVHAIERCSNSVKRLADLRLDTNRHGFAGHRTHCNTT